MLQSIRDYTQGWIAGVIISIIILTFVLWGIHGYVAGSGNSNIVAEVNDVEITKDQLSVAYQRLRRQVQSQSGSAYIKDEAVLKQRALQAIIDIEVLKQGSLAQGFYISNAQIDNYLQNMPEFQVEGQFSVERFNEVLSATLLSTAEFLDLIKTTLLIDQPKLGIVFTSFALPDETAYTISLVNQERNLDYAKIPLQFMLSRMGSIPAADIKAYYDKHQAQFMTPEQASIEYVELSLDDLASYIKPTAQMLKKFYNENLNAYTQPMKWKLADIFIPVSSDASDEETKQAEKNARQVALSLQDGEDFSSLAQRYSRGQLSKEWLTLNQVPLELQKSIAGLTRAGQVSEPVKTNLGWVVIKVVSIAEPSIEPYDSVETKVQDAYIRQHAEEKFADLREQLASLSYEHPESLEYVSESLNLAVKSTGLFTKAKPGADISQNKKVRNTAFSSDVLNLQNNSDVIQLAPGKVIVMRIKSHIASSLLPLDSVSDKIEKQLRSTKADEELGKYAQQVVSELNSGANPASLKSASQLQWKTAGYVGRYSTKVVSAVLDLGFRIPHPEKGKTAYGAGKMDDGYVIVAVKGIKDGVVANNKQSLIFAEQVQNSEGLLEYELYRQSQINNADIEIYQK